MLAAIFAQAKKLVYSPVSYRHSKSVQSGLDGCEMGRNMKKVSTLETELAWRFTGFPSLPGSGGRSRLTSGQPKAVVRARPLNRPLPEA